MPVLQLSLDDPTNVVLQGEQLRSSAFGWAVGFPLAMAPVLEGDQTLLSAPPMPLVAGGQTFGAMVGGDAMPNVEVLRSPFVGTMVAANAGIATPCGAWIPTSGASVLLNPFVQSTTRFAFVGTTRDSAGAALGSCVVTAFYAGRMSVDGVEAEMGVTTSDGAGAYTLPVGYNAAHQLIAYKAGGTDVAGISANTVVPSAVG